MTGRCGELRDGRAGRVQLRTSPRWIAAAAPLIWTTWGRRPRASLYLAHGALRGEEPVSEVTTQFKAAADVPHQFDFRVLNFPLRQLSIFIR